MTKTTTVRMNNIRIGLIGHVPGAYEEGFDWVAEPDNGSIAGCHSQASATIYVEEVHEAYMNSLPDKLLQAEKDIQEVRESMDKYKGTIR